MAERDLWRLSFDHRPGQYEASSFGVLLRSGLPSFGSSAAKHTVLAEFQAIWKPLGVVHDRTRIDSPRVLSP